MKEKQIVFRFSLVLRKLQIHIIMCIGRSSDFSSVRYAFPVYATSGKECRYISRKSRPKAAKKATYSAYDPAKELQQRELLPTFTTFPFNPVIALPAQTWNHCGDKCITFEQILQKRRRISNSGKRTFDEQKNTEQTLAHPFRTVIQTITLLEENYS